MLHKENISRWFQELQVSIAAQLGTADGSGRFSRDTWRRDEGGGGVSMIMEEGKVIEKGGVNFSEVHGIAPPSMVQLLELAGAAPHTFFATGISIVIHPYNPLVPIIHMNLRYFELEDETWWFGGGIDLTPHYIDKEDARYFHQHLKNVCDKHHPSYYPQFKAQADEYFFIKHRRETRGIGGIFFDHLKETSTITAEARLEFIKDVGLIFAPLYTYLMKKNQNHPFGEREGFWQSIRRGRYVEFNLVYDRGTKFGLETDARTESILMSLPPRAHWKYVYEPEKWTREEQTVSLLRKGIDWLTL